MMVRILYTGILLLCAILPVWFVFVCVASIGIFVFRWYVEGLILVGCYMLWYHGMPLSYNIVILLIVVLLITLRSTVLPRFLRV
jgi:hypothetical protein